MRCQDSNRTTTQPSSSSMASLEISESAVEDVIFAGFVIFNIIWGRFWHSLLSELFKGERTPFANQQLMANEESSRLVRAYASND